MSRSIQFCALFYLLSSIAAEPTCDGIEAKYLENCRALHRRWYELQDELFLQKCKPLRRDDIDAYNSCVLTINKETTDQLHSELFPEHAENSILNPFTSFGAKPTLLNGKLLKIDFPKEDQSWFSKIFG